MMTALGTMLLMLGCLTMQCSAWPVGIPAHHARAVNPYYTSVGGSSIVNVFPAGYSYQTLLNDGSSSYVIYVSGPESQQYLRNFAHASSLPPALVLNEKPLGPKDIPPSVQAIDTAPGSDSIPEPVTPTSATPSPTEETPNVPPTGESKPEPNTPGLPLALPQQQPLFHFYPFSPFSNFPVVSTYIANPFNSLMSFLGVPPPQRTNNQTITNNVDSETTNNNNDAQASNVNAVTAPLVARLATISPVADISTQASITDSTTESKLIEAVTPGVSTESSSQTSENESREETTTPSSPVTSVDIVARVVSDPSVSDVTIASTPLTTDDIVANVVSEPVTNAVTIASSPVTTEDSVARVVSEPNTSDTPEVSLEPTRSSVSDTAELILSTENTESVESTSAVTLDTQSTTTDEISTQNSE